MWGEFGGGGGVQYKFEFIWAAVLWKCQWVNDPISFWSVRCVTSVDATVNLISRGILIS